MKRMLSAMTISLSVIIASLFGVATRAYAADGCTYNNPYTVHEFAYPPRVELRANVSQVCAWGRITQARDRDLVWVDRSRDGGRTWEQLSITEVDCNPNYNNCNAFTEAYNDVGKLMRACMAIWDYFGNRYKHPTCTPWW